MEIYDRSAVLRIINLAQSSRTSRTRKYVFDVSEKFVLPEAQMN